MISARTRGLREWLRYWWLTIPEPRDLSLAWGTAYAVLLATGVAAIVAPPVVGVCPYSWHALATVGWLLVFSSVIAIIGGWREFWKLERIGIAGMGGGAILFGAVTIGLMTTGPVLVVLGFVSFVIATLAIRYLMIWRYTYRPRG